MARSELSTDPGWSALFALSPSAATSNRWMTQSVTLGGRDIFVIPRLTRGRYGVLRRALDVFLDLSVADVDDAVRVRRDVGFVRDEDDRVAGLVQLGEQPHDFDAGLRVEVAGRLVGEQDRRVVDERARDGDALALAARELVRPVVIAVAQLDLVERLRWRASCASFAGTPA